MLEGEIVRKCLARSDKQCSFVEHRNYKARSRAEPRCDVFSGCSASQQPRQSPCTQRPAPMLLRDALSIAQGLFSSVRRRGRRCRPPPDCRFIPTGHLPPVRLALLPRRSRRRRERARDPRVHPLPRAPAHRLALPLPPAHCSLCHRPSAAVPQRRPHQRPRVRHSHCPSSARPGRDYGQVLRQRLRA